MNHVRRGHHALAFTCAAVCGVAIQITLAADLEKCPADLNALFRVADQESLGLWVMDRAAVIGGVVADEKFHNRLLNAFMPLPGWYPVDGTKRVVCGAMEEWTLYRGPGRELDLHPYIVPSPSFRPIIDDLPPYGRTDAGKDHIWGEVTPPEWFAPFWQVPGSTPAGGDNACALNGGACRATEWTNATACMYGPWVMERVYGYRVEIHPVQAIWGKEGERVRMYVLSDESQRFEAARSYRRTGTTERFVTWSRPMSPMVWVAVEAQPQQALAVSVVRGTLDPSAARVPVTTTRIDLGGASVNVTHSGDLQISRGPACRADSGAIRGFVAAAAAPQSELHVLDISGDVLSHNLGQTRVHEEATRTAETEQDVAKDALAPSIDLRAVEWAPPERLSSGLAFPRTRADFGFTNADPVRWTTAQQQRLKVRITTGKGSPPPAGSQYWVDWKITACDLEGTDGACRPTPIGEGSNGPYVELSHGSRIATTVSDGVRELKNAGPYEAVVFVRYAPPRQLGPTLVTSSLRIDVSATLRDTKNHETTFRHVLRNVAPDFSSEVQAYDVERNHGTIPDRLIVWSLGWLKQQGFTVTRPELERDWSLGPASNGEVLGPLNQQERRRRARVLRLSMLTFLEDHTLDAEEIRDIFEMLTAYGESTWTS